MIEKINKLLPYIPTDNIIDLKELIYAGAKLVIKSVRPQGTQTDAKKSGCEIRLKR